jgi:hypothetical protein
MFIKIARQDTYDNSQVCILPGIQYAIFMPMWKLQARRIELKIVLQVLQLCADCT